jgi:predicted outer membrane repeat protein
MDYAAPLLEDCTFTGNSSDAIGGAIHTGFYSLPTFRRCVFRENIAHTGGAGLLQGTVTVEDCDFIANEARFGGGLELSAGPQNIVTRSRFTGNSATDEGGGVRIAVGEPLIQECVFANNQSPLGGALQLYDATATLVHCTITGNSSGIMVGRDGSWLPSFLFVSNSIISGSTIGAAVRCSAPSTANLTCCDVFGNPGGDWDGCIAGQSGVNGNFSRDPCFCDAPGGDFTLGAASPCAPENSPAGCEQVGALPVGCTILCPGTTAIEPALVPATWGQIKAMHR